MTFDDFEFDDFEKQQRQQQQKPKEAKESQKENSTKKPILLQLSAHKRVFSDCWLALMKLQT